MRLTLGRRFQLVAILALIGMANTASSSTDVSGEISTDTAWDRAGSPYMLQGSVTILKGAVLHVAAGVVVKASSPSAELRVLGTLVSSGTPSDPIIYTSWKDDTVGGDTDGDGVDTAPAPGDWAGIGFAGSSRDTSALENSEIRFAHYYGELGNNFAVAADENGPQLDAAVERRVRRACGACHVFPEPSILPRELWGQRVGHMADFIGALSRFPANAFSVSEVSQWYLTHSPASFTVPEPNKKPKRGPVRFRGKGVILKPDGGPQVPTVRRIGPAELAGSDAGFVAPNMETGSVHLFSRTQGPKKVGEAGHPVRVDVADFDGDDKADLLISDLGSVIPSDELVGRVIIGRNQGEGNFAFQTIVAGLPRVADARAIDLDGDADLDVAVAAFGWRNSGGVFVLRNGSTATEPLRFTLEKVIDRSGAVSIVPVEDLMPGSGTGFVVAFAQHHELVSVFHPKPDSGTGWEETLLYRAPHPDWGISNLEPVDLDADGDLDFLLSHGDTLDVGFAYKPQQGVEWLRNDGRGGFELERIGLLYGAHGAEAADIDGDGDLDVVACGFLPQLAIPFVPGSIPVDSLVWYERRGKRWSPWTIETNYPRHTGLTLMDWNDDGRMDILATNNQSWIVTKEKPRRSMQLWLNLGAAPPGEKSKRKQAK